MLRLRSLPVVVAQPDKNIRKNIAFCLIGKIDAEKNIVIRKKKTRIIRYFLFAKKVNFEHRKIAFKFSWICPIANISCTTKEYLKFSGGQRKKDRKIAKKTEK